MEHILKPIWDEKYLYTGNGNTFGSRQYFTMNFTIELVERLDILTASNAAGNTGERNELMSVCDELRRQRLVDKHTYKIIMLQL